jgi:hypothetical protein
LPRSACRVAHRSKLMPCASGRSVP